jgi:hypothetical protein
MAAGKSAILIPISIHVQSVGSLVKMHDDDGSESDNEGPIADLNKIWDGAQVRDESIVRLDDAAVIQFSEPPAAIAARESLARLAKANAAFKAEKAASSPPLSPDLAALRVAAAYHRAIETSLGRDERIQGPHLELVAALKELGLEKHYSCKTDRRTLRSCPPPFHFLSFFDPVRPQCMFRLMS